MKGKYQMGIYPRFSTGKVSTMAKEIGNQTGMVKALDKLTYFVQRQKEVYGTL
jgi:hypothetical protein